MSEAEQLKWHVRPARHGDVEAVAAAVRELLMELGGPCPATPAMEAAARSLLEDGAAGALLVAETAGALVGMLAASWQIAIHVPGSYVLIQDLWVHPSWRSKAIGATLIDAIIDLAREKGVKRVQVGLPLESFARFGATEAFYLTNGFTPSGPRMKRLLS